MTKNLRTLDIAMKLFMKFGVKSVTMDDISKEAGVSKKTIYAMVTNKAQLIDFVVERYMLSERNDINKIVADSKNALEEMIKITEHVIYFLRNIKPSLTYDLKKYYKTSWDKVEKTHFTFIRDTINANIKRGKKEKIYREVLKEEIIAQMYLQLSNSMVNDDLFPIKSFTKVELFENFVDYHMHGILTENGLKKYKEYKSNDE